MALCQGIGPSTVLGEITEPTVYAIKRHIFGAFAHVGKEVLKFLPSFANRYAIAAVRRIFLVPGPLASSFHSLPRYPGWGQRHSMSCESNAMALTTETSTRSYLSSLKRITANFFCFSAIAAAEPAQVLTLLFGQPKNDKVVEALSGKTAWWHHSHKITYERR